MKSHYFRILAGFVAGIALCFAGAGALSTEAKGDAQSAQTAPQGSTSGDTTSPQGQPAPQANGAPGAAPQAHPLGSSAGKGPVIPPAPRAQRSEPPPLVPVTVTAGPEPWYTIFGTAEGQGSIEHCGCPHNPGGGLPRRAGYVNLYRETFKSSPVLWLDAGNWADRPTAPGGAIKTKTLLSGMHDIGYAAANISERDVDPDYAAFLERKDAADFPLISANLVLQSTGKPIAEPYVIVKFDRKQFPALKDTLRIAVAGVTRFNATFQRPGPSNDTIITAQPADELKKYIAEMRKKADQVIVLADIAPNEAHELARSVPGIDVIVGGYLSLLKDVEKEGTTSIVYCGSEGKFLAEMRAFQQGDTTDLKTMIHYLSLNYPADPALQAKVDAAQIEINQANKAPVPAGASPNGAGSKGGTR